MALIRFERSGPITTLTLNRPERHNALVPELLDELLAALQSVRADPENRVVILAAAGRSFSTGGDARGFVEHEADAAAYARRLVGRLNQVILAIIDMPVPVIAAIQGAVSGGSIGLVLGADLILMTPEALIQPFYSDIGPSPDGGWTALLPAIIGQKRAAALLFLNEPISATTAIEWGLAAQIVPAEQLPGEARRVAQTIAGKKKGSLRHTRALLWQERPAIAGRLEAELERFVEHIATDEARAGWRAFLERPKSDPPAAESSDGK